MSKKDFFKDNNNKRISHMVQELRDQINDINKRIQVLRDQKNDINATEHNVPKLYGHFTDTSIFPYKDALEIIYNKLADRHILTKSQEETVHRIKNKVSNPQDTKERDLELKVLKAYNTNQNLNDNFSDGSWRYQYIAMHKHPSHKKQPIQDINDDDIKSEDPYNDVMNPTPNQQEAEEVNTNIIGNTTVENDNSDCM